ncbi:MAG: hypothetical protein F6K47_10540 [Symploca sp. SIO2E6]|nr:hypothetical protein [Symploca sp. SIO2E6]
MSSVRIVVGCLLLVVWLFGCLGIGNWELGIGSSKLDVPYTILDVKFVSFGLY